MPLRSETDRPKEALKKMKNFTVLTFALIAAVSLAFSEGPIDERRPLAPDGVLHVENVAGSVTVVGWSKDEVEIKGTLGRGTRGLDISGDQRSLSVEVEFEDEHESDSDNESDDRGGRSHRDRGDRTVESTDLVIHAPRGASFEIETVAATVDVSEIAGGAVSLESVSGRIRVKGSPRTLEVSIVSGDSEIALDGPLETGDFESVVGDITLETDLQATGRLKVETVGGSITLRLREDVSAQFDISTFNGSISSDFGGQPKKTSEHLPSTEMRFSTGGGGARISVETLNGDIKLVRR